MCVGLYSSNTPITAKQRHLGDDSMNSNYVDRKAARGLAYSRTHSMQGRILHPER